MSNPFKMFIYTHKYWSFSLLLLGILSCSSKVQTAQSLFQENFHPFPNVLFDLEQDTLQPNPRVLTFLAYRKKNYEEALNYSEKIKPLTANDPIQLYRGVCLMALEKIDEAEQLLTVLSQEESDYRDAANWYLALCKLKRNELTASKAHLKKLSNRSTYIRNEAQVLLKKVENLTRE